MINIKLFNKKEFTMFKRMILPLALMMASGAASAGIVTNETELLSGSDHAQLSEWLGEDFDLTRIFAKKDGDTSYDWHAAVDGKGATFTVMEIIDNDTDEVRVIGGYNSMSWASINQYGTTQTTFLFNLSDGLLFEKNSRYTSGQLATYNGVLYGSTFGGGHDLYVGSDLTTGYAEIGHTYGDIMQFRDDSYREQFAGTLNNWTIGAYETYTLSASTGEFGTGAAVETTDVPVSFLLGGLGLLGIGVARRRPGV
tara:strand:- start:337 stop:1098 length:762 start_codon:yes stop_codon:yes gene_type:complete